MKTTERERLILTLLPLALVLGGYAWWFNVFQRKEVVKRETAYERAAKDAVRPVDVMEQQARVKMLERELAELQAEEQRLDEQVAAACATLGGAMNRMRAVEDLTLLFASHGLAILEDCPVGSGHKTKIAPCVAEAVQRLSGSSADKQGHVRCVHFHGRYMDVLAAMEAIASAESSPIVPIGLTMEEADANSDVREWMLAVWM